MLDEEQTISPVKNNSNLTVDEEKKTHYAILGVDTNAAPAQISAAYKKLSLIYHPDRNANDDTASAKLFEINEAFHTLNDPSKRSAYDASIPEIAAANAAAGTGSVNGAAGGADGSLVGILSNFASVAMRVATTTPMFSQDLPSGILTTAKILCDLPSFESAAPLREDATMAATLESRQLTQLTFMDLAPLGLHIDARVERLQCNYYRLEVTPEMHSSGFLVQCLSEAKDKFKVLVFDSKAELQHCENSHRARDRANTSAVLHCNSAFDTFTLTEGSAGLFTIPGSIGGASPRAAAPATVDGVVVEPGPVAVANAAIPGNMEGQGPDKAQLPHLFSRIKSIDASRKLFSAPGFYLVGVVGENFVGRSSYRLVAAPHKTTSSEIRVMREADASLLTVQRSLGALEDKYLTTKAAYEAALGEIRDTEKELERVVEARDLSYRSFVVESLHECSPEHNVDVVASTKAALDAHASMKAQANTHSAAGDQGGILTSAAAAGSTDLRVPRLRVRRDSIQEVQIAAAAVATKAGEVVTGAATTATETASSYGGWMSQKLAGE